VSLRPAAVAKEFQLSLPPRGVTAAGRADPITQNPDKPDPDKPDPNKPGVKMSTDDFQKQAGIARLTSDLRAAKIELLSAQCAADRLRLQYSIADIVSFGERQALRGAIASAGALCRFFSSIEDELKQADRKE
jgi:hypothetical protein